uniref:K Homology domain-containing protein n=1 Tax=Microcebus murinus TaxID=30608 RepID=A0A8C5XXJ8_MICMU
ISTQWTSWTSLLPASATVACILYRRYRGSREERLTFVREDDIEIEIGVPQEAVKLTTGRQGANIKQLRKQTGARIDVDTEDAVLLISGFPVQGEAVSRFVLLVRPLEPRLPVTKNQRGHYYYQDL